jgi:ribosomal protein S18 acetylase RimI-like enzyme/predicted RNase H-like HicB family nuclease
MVAMSAKKTYVAIYERDEHDDAWNVRIDGLEGCQSYGRSLRQAHRRIREALALWLDREPENLSIRDELPQELAEVAQHANQARAEAERAAAGSARCENPHGARPQPARRCRTSRPLPPARATTPRSELNPVRHTTGGVLYPRTFLCPEHTPGNLARVDEDSVICPTIRRVRSDEGHALRAIRLAALKESPFAFGSLYEAEAERTDDQWTARAQLGAAGADRVTFFALVKGQIVGLVGAYRPEPDGSTVDLVSMWTSPETRREGVGRALVSAVLDWASDASATTVALWVTQGNAPAQRLYESMGFRETGESQPLPSDPSKDELRMTLGL